MSVASFLARFAKPLDAIVVSVKSASVVEPDAAVSFEGASGVVAFLDGDRVVWVDDEGFVHMTLRKYVEGKK